MNVLDGTVKRAWQAAAFLILACVTGCSAASGRFPVTAARASAPSVPAPGKPAATPQPGQATPQPFGSVDTDPSAPPLVMSSRGAVPRRAPSRTLPAGWNSGAWFAQVRVAAGPNLVQHDYPVDVPARGDTVLAWEWSSAGVRKIGVSTELDTHKSPLVLNCFGQGFNPSDRRAVSSVSSIIARCLSAPFPGADAAAAGPWVRHQLSLMLRDITTDSQVKQIASSTPTFGSAVYWLQEVDVPNYGITITLQVT